MEPILKVRNLQTGYGDLRVVWDVSFDVYPGQVTALLGRNGAGKTSTLRALSGLNKVASGTVEMDGADITGVPAHKRVRQGMAYVQEGKRVFHKQTVEQMLKAASTNVKAFTLYVVGEGIEKKVDDFAAEVAAQVAAAKGAA